MSNGFAGGDKEGTDPFGRDYGDGILLGDVYIVGFDRFGSSTTLALVFSKLRRTVSVKHLPVAARLP